MNYSFVVPNFLLSEGFYFFLLLVSQEILRFTLVHMGTSLDQFLVLALLEKSLVIS